jgi:hypothetical protein
MKNAVFWDVAPCRSCELNRRFRGTYSLHLQRRKIRERGTSVSRWLQTKPPIDNTQLYKNRRGGRVGTWEINREERGRVCGDGGDTFLRNVGSIYKGVFDWWFSLQPPAHAGSSLANFSTLKMEVIRSSETLVQFTRSTRRHIPEDGILHSHRRENLKSYTVPKNIWCITCVYVYTSSYKVSHT